MATTSFALIRKGVEKNSLLSMMEKLFPLKVKEIYPRMHTLL